MCWLSQSKIINNFMVLWEEKGNAKFTKYGESFPLTTIVHSSMDAQRYSPGQYWMEMPTFFLLVSVEAGSGGMWVGSICFLESLHGDQKNIFRRKK